MFDFVHVCLEPSDAVLPAGLILPQGRVDLFLLLELLLTPVQTLRQLLDLRVEQGTDCQQTVSSRGQTVSRLSAAGDRLSADCQQQGTDCQQTVSSRGQTVSRLLAQGTDCQQQGTDRQQTVHKEHRVQVLMKTREHRVSSAAATGPEQGTQTGTMSML